MTLLPADPYAFGDVLSKGTGLVHAGHPDFGSVSDTDAVRIQAAIDFAAAQTPVPDVMVPRDMLPYSGVTFNSAVKMIAEGGDWSRYEARAYGADPSASGADNRTALQAALAAAVAASGGRVHVRIPGVYDLNEAGQAHPYNASHRFCLDIAGDDVTLSLGDGVTLKLADGQQTDANGAVDIIVLKDRTNVRIVGAGPEASKIVGNTAGQAGWTGGYSQTTNGNLIDVTDGAGTGGLVVEGLELSDHFSNPVYVDGSLSAGDPVHGRVSLRRLHCFDVGEGPVVVGAKRSDWEDITVRDPSDVMVGDALEPSTCDQVFFRNIRILGAGGSNGAGSVIDVFGCKGVVGEGIVCRDWLGSSGFVFQTNGSLPRTTEEVAISDVIVTGATNAVLVVEAESFRLGNGHFEFSMSGANPMVFRTDTAAVIAELSNVRLIDTLDDAAPVLLQDQVTLRLNGFYREGGRRGFDFTAPNDGAGAFPRIEWTGGRLTGINGDAFQVDGGGVAVAPEGWIKGVSLDVGGSVLNEQNSGLFTNLDMDQSIRIPDAQRPAAGVAGRTIFNTTDGQLNIDDGTNWTLPDGTTT